MPRRERGDAIGGDRTRHIRTRQMTRVARETDTMQHLRVNHYRQRRNVGAQVSAASRIPAHRQTVPDPDLARHASLPSCDQSIRCQNRPHGEHVQHVERQERRHGPQWREPHAEHDLVRVLLEPHQLDAIVGLPPDDRRQRRSDGTACNRAARAARTCSNSCTRSRTSFPTSARDSRCATGSTRGCRGTVS